ncbi:hypothetical protein EJB05_49294, partial [Eragrostis curvula]
MRRRHAGPVRLAGKRRTVRRRRRVLRAWRRRRRRLRALRRQSGRPRRRLKRLLLLLIGAQNTALILEVHGESVKLEELSWVMKTDGDTLLMSVIRIEHAETMERRKPKPGEPVKKRGGCGAE